MLLTLASLLVLVVLVFFYRLFRRSTIAHIKGPSSPSFLFGHERALEIQNEVGDLEFKWQRDYGPTWRIAGNFGSDILMTADPKALHHVLQKSGYNYVRRVSQNQLGKIMTGPGIVTSDGPDHHRHRKIMTPAFGTAHLRSFVPTFQHFANKLSEKWKAQLPNDGEMEVMVNKWVSRVTLDIIGEAAFDYDYGALNEGDSSALCKAYDNIFKDMGHNPSFLFALVRATWDYLPQIVLDAFRYIPADPFTRLRSLNDFFFDYGKQILREQRAAINAGACKDSKDIMSILIKANASEDPKTRLSDAELMAEMFTLTLAGHESTAASLTFLFYELARHPEYQDRMRDEIRQLRADVTARGDDAFNPDDLDSLTVTMNAIKETFRYHSIVQYLSRVAAKDDVIPLMHPVTSTKGETVKEVPIRAGQVVITAFSGYHRLTDVWGDDADVWNPDRWTRPDMGKQTNVGVFANLMTFSGGIRGCIGYKFTILEMQAIVVEFIENFRFSPPAEQVVIKRAPAGAIMVPMIAGKEELNVAMPLRISLAHK
ncbi:cytochrome P450 [Daedaleopsis nitida]|nr:cytochrome P450 [Daedaleopsis nitida]